jgi:hypothetical protein
MDAVRKGIKQFQLKYSYPTSLSPNAPSLEKYYTVISVHKGSEAEQEVKKQLQELGWNSKVIIVNEENG